MMNEESDLVHDQKDAEKLIGLPQTFIHLVYENLRQYFQALSQRF